MDKYTLIYHASSHQVSVDLPPEDLKRFLSMLTPLKRSMYHIEHPDFPEEAMRADMWYIDNEFTQFGKPAGLFRKLFHRHWWVRVNDAPEDLVPDSYPPTVPIAYTSPLRCCAICGDVQALMGPEVIGGSRARWVEAPRYLRNLNGVKP